MMDDEEVIENEEYEIVLEVKPGFNPNENFYGEKLDLMEDAVVETEEDVVDGKEIEMAVKTEVRESPRKIMKRNTVKRLMPKIKSKRIKMESGLSESPDEEKKPKKPRPTADCEICGKTFKNKTILKGHVVAIHEKLKPYVCSVCGVAYAHQRSLYRHKLTHTDIKPYLCQDCGTSFRDISHYYRHRDIHLNNKNYYCEVCGVAFRRQHHLDQHMFRHTGNKPLQCHLCHYKCRQTSQLSNHIKRHHTHIFEHACEFCDRKCVTRSELKGHMSSCKGRLHKIATQVIPVNFQGPLVQPSTDKAKQYVEVQTEKTVINESQVEHPLSVNEVSNKDDSDYDLPEYYIVEDENGGSSNYDIVSVKENDNNLNEADMK